MSTGQDTTSPSGRRAREYAPDDTPNTVIGAVVAGTVVVPFLAVLGFLFVAHGLFINVDQPDVTDSRTTEALFGGGLLLFLAFVLIGLNRMLNGRGRWMFLVGQLVTLGVSIDFVIDRTRGEPAVPAVVLAASLLAVVLTFVPDSWGWVVSQGGHRQLPAAPQKAEKTGS